MDGSEHDGSPSSSAVAARLLAMVPPILAQPWLDLALGAMTRRHPAVFRRLADLGDRRVRVVLRDLGAAFELAFGVAPGRPALELVAPGARAAPAATIRAGLRDLVALVEGRIDGDALFFERELVVEGDMEVVLALRNAVDGAEIDVLRDLADLLGPLAPLAERAGRDALALHRAVTGVLQATWAALLAPSTRRIERIERDLRRLEARQAARPGVARRAMAVGHLP